METVTDRFYLAFDVLTSRGNTGLREFCREIKTRHSSFIKQREERHRNIIRPHWLNHIAAKYDVSPTWLLLGKGEMFNPK
jgi:hypothetical protein